MSNWPIPLIRHAPLNFHEMNYFHSCTCDLCLNPQMLKPATPTEISLLVIKEAGGRARNNIQILTALDRIACRTNHTLPAAPEVCVLLEGSKAGGMTRTSPNAPVRGSAFRLNAVLIYHGPHAGADGTQPQWTLDPLGANKGRVLDDDCHTCPQWQPEACPQP